jgi:hypothetical protein
MRTELKIKRLLTKHTTYRRYDPCLEQAEGEPIVMETVYCFKESDLKKFVSGLIDIQIKAREQGLNPRPQFYEQYIGVEE